MIPRLRPGKKTALQLASPIITDITSLAPSIAQDVTRYEGRILLGEIASLVRDVCLWATVSASADDLVTMKVTAITY